MADAEESNRRLEEKMKKGFEEFKKKVLAFKFAREKYLNAYQNDPLAKLFVNIFKLSPFKAGILGFGVVFFTYFVGYLIHFLTGQEVAGITKTSIDITYDFFIIPIVYGYYVWTSTKPMTVFLDLKENDISLGTDEAYDEYVIHLSKHVINNRLICLVSLLIAIGLTIKTIHAAATGSEIWGPIDADYFVFYFIKVPITWAIPWYMLCVAYIKELLSIWAFRRLLKHENLQINMFHRDRCGGLKPVSDYLLTFTYYIVACGVGFFLLITRSIKFGYFREDILVNFSFFIYIGVSYVFFYFPLHPVHKLMRRLGEDLRDKIKIAEFIPSRAFTPATLRKFSFAIASPIIFFSVLTFKEISFPYPAIFLVGIFLHLIIANRWAFVSARVNG